MEPWAWEQMVTNPDREKSQAMRWVWRPPARGLCRHIFLFCGNLRNLRLKHSDLCRFLIEPGFEPGHYLFIDLAGPFGGGCFGIAAEFGRIARGTQMDYLF